MLKLKLELELVFRLYVGRYGIAEMIVSLTERTRFIFADYSYGYLLDSAMVSTPPGGSAAAYGYWMHTAPDGRSGYLQPGYLAAC